MRWIRLAPIVAESLIISVAIFASCLFQASSNRERFVDVQRSWGAIGALEQVAVHDGIRRPKDPELYGPFDVWDGEWWRIPFTAYHHANLLHLVLCLGGAWYLGSRLERYWGSFAFGLFLVPALFVPVMAELCIGNSMLGLSGAICAMLGALSVLRQFDPRLSRVFPIEASAIGMGIVFLGSFATLADLVVFPNAAHLAGLTYGAATAWLVGGPLRHVMLLRLSLVLAHLWLIPGVFIVMHPFWIGRYHWYRAVSAPGPQRAETSLERATQLDPSLTGAWLYWSQLAEDRGETLVAWHRIIDALHFNPSSIPLMDGCRRLWRHLDATQRKDAEGALSQFFGPQSRLWLSQIRGESSVPGKESNENARNLIEAIDLSDVKLDQPLELPRIELAPIRTDQTIPKTQIIPNDASEGETL